MSVIGVDPGLNGALAVYDNTANSLSVEDMPTWQMMVNNKTRKRVDAVTLMDYFDLQRAMGAELVVIEAVGGRPKQSAAGAFVFGYTVGLVYMACVAVKLPIETVPPQTWKKILNVPGKRVKKGEPKKTDKEINGAIINRADELLPNHRALWRGKKEGFKLDRAEAAMLALYGARYALHSTKPMRISDDEWRLAYRGADTGA